MAIKPLQQLSREWYTPESEKDEADPTQFELKPMTVEQFERVAELSEQGMNIPPKNYAMVLRFGLVGWRNFDAKFTIANFSSIPLALRMELSTEIISRSVNSEDDIKNS